MVFCCLVFLQPKVPDDVVSRWIERETPAPPGDARQAGPVWTKPPGGRQHFPFLRLELKNTPVFRMEGSKNQLFVPGEVFFGAVR